MNIVPKFNLFTPEQLIEIIKMKSLNKTTQEVTDYIKKNFGGIYINRNFISKLWLGEDVGLSDNIKSTQEYLDMIDNKKRRTVKSKKFTENEINWLRKNNLDKSLSQRCELFEKQYNKTITKAYLSKLNF